MKIDLKFMGIGLAAFAAAAWFYKLYEECLDVMAAAIFPSRWIRCANVTR